jgi:subtilisin family serine protease
MHKLIVITVLVGVAFATSNKIHPTLANSLNSKKTANIIISFVGGNTQVVNAIEIQSFQTRTQRLNSLASSLKTHAKQSQQQVLSFLKSKSVQHKSFWISNQIYIVDADKNLVEAISNFPEVSIVEEERIITLDTPVNSKQVRKADPTPLAEWGIEKIKAEEAWAVSNGSGVVVANIDTGVRYTHEAVRDNYRADYGWFDPYAQTQTPNDQNGHGTHTMGTIAGSKGVGVAPGAQWIACKGCSTSSCSQSALTGCGQWALCPTKPNGQDEDCSKAPVLVSNSWGGGRGDNWYEGITEAWIAGGIVPIFANGNSGPSCGTANSPADIRRVIAVGATNVRDEIASFSSVGPAADGRIKPEISAPGEDVRSAIPDSDSSYGTMSGTSMACPHAAGATALALAVNPNLSFGELRRILLAGVDTELSSKNAACGGITDTTYPNHHFGWGRINALKIVQGAQATLKH